MTANKKDYLHVRIDSDLKEKFQKINKSKSINGSDLIRRWIEDYVKKEE